MEYSSPPCLLHEIEKEDAGGRQACDVRIKRIYEEPARSDGLRVLVDRLWPRGMRKENAAIDEWLKALAPSAPLRKWFGHEASRWVEFRRRYRSELAAQGDELARLAQQAQRKRVTLLYAARDPQINHAVVLREAIRERAQAGGARDAR
jgi:uncharacterized protein YeaO (DUF488 family)